MKFGDVVGSINVDAGHIRSFAQAWFEPDDLVSIAAFPIDPGLKFNALPQVVTASALASATDEDIRSMCFIDDGKKRYRCNLYFAANPIKEENSIGQKGSRGTEKDVREVYGVFMDFDIQTEKKVNCFLSKDDIYKFLSELECPPTIIVDNGQSGGVHAYWRLNSGQTGYKELILRWWAYISSKTPHKIDKLIDTIRVSRLPSGIYWGVRDGAKSDTVKVVTNSGPRYDLNVMENVSEDAYVAYKSHTTKLINREYERKWGSLPIIASEIYKSYSGDGHSWDALRMIAFIEDIYNDKVDWQDILAPHGWTFLRDLNDGSREWARPGREERSAVTDYDDGVHGPSPVMSLMSMAEETGIADLKEASIPLTKYRVSLRLDFNDDEEAFMNHIKTTILGLN